LSGSQRVAEERDLSENTLTAYQRTWLKRCCLGGGGAAPPESCGGPRGYQLMLKRQQQGATVSDPALAEATIQLLSATHPESPR